MDLRTVDDNESRFLAYVERLVSVIGHADRAGPLRDYCTGLMLPCERKSVEPMAARLSWLEPAFIYRMTAYCILRMQTLEHVDEAARQRYADATAAELARLEALARVC